MAIEFSVLMSVHSKDSHNHLDEAIYSIIDAQILKPTEIIIIQDGPINNQLLSVIDNWKTKHANIFKVFELSQNMGLASALNFGLEKCSFDIVARMDADDISDPERFLKQIKFLEVNKNISVVSSIIEEFDYEMKKSLGFRNVPLEHGEFHSFIISRNPFNHPAVIFRRNDVLKVGGYPLFDRAQDYALWSLMFVKGYKFANLGESLLKMRTGLNMMNRRGLKYFQHEAKILQYQLNLGLINKFQYTKNLILRWLVRVQPSIIKKQTYKMIKLLNK